MPGQLHWHRLLIRSRLLPETSETRLPRELTAPSVFKGAWRRTCQAKLDARLPEGHEQELVHALNQIYRPDVRLAEPADKDGRATEREILPLALMYTQRTLTAFARCSLREDFRMFHGERIEQAKDAGRSCRSRRAGLVRDYLARLRDRSDT